MSTPRTSLLRDLLKSLALPGLLVVVIGVAIVHNLVEEEYDELLDQSLHTEAQLLLRIYEHAAPALAAAEPETLTGLMSFEAAVMEAAHRTKYWFVDGAGQILARSETAQEALFPDDLSEGLYTANGHRYAILSKGRTSVIVAASMAERNEAIRDVVLGTVLGFIVLSLLFAGAAFRAARRSAGVIARLSANIAEKNEHNLAPIDRKNSFAEIEPAVDTLDTLMARLDAALTAERAFATNAAHELRTPVAISLAHVQRLKARLADPALTGSAQEIEQGLKRLIRLIERLLQMSRAQSGLGLGTRAADITPVINLMLKELRTRAPDTAQLEIIPPTAPWISKVDPDAIGIILGNLFDNALKYSSGAMPVTVDAATPGRLSISNDCDPLAPGNLAAITERFIRKTPVSQGFGLGLSIVQDLCRQAACSLEIRSPGPGYARGFSVTLTFPGEPPG